MKRKRQIKRYITYSAIILAVIAIFVGILVFLNNNKNSYTLLEKKWISENASSSIKIKVNNSIPIFALEGDGVVYDYLKDLEEDTKLTFDIVTSGTADYEFLSANEKNEDNILFYTDVYSVVTNKDLNVNSISDLSDKKIGVLKDDISYINYYFTNEKNLKFKEYESFSKLTEALEKEIDVMLIPTNEYINEILENKYTILYKVDGLNKYYELNTEAGNKNLNSIMKKFMNKWEDKLLDKYNQNKLELFKTNKNVSDMEVQKVSKQDLKVGYIKNLPLEGKVQKNFTGITNEYLEGFASFSGATYKYIKYKNIDSLKNALSNKKVDIVMNYSDLSNVNYDTTDYIKGSNYVVLAHVNNDLVVDNIYSLKNNRVTMLANNNLTKYFKSQKIFSVTEKETVKELLKDLNEDTIIIVDKIVYETYKTKKLKNYSIRYLDENSVGYNFLTLKENNNLSEMFGFYVKTTSSKQMSNDAIKNTTKVIKNSTVLGFILTNIAYFILIGLVITYLLIKYRKRVKVQKKIKREDKMMYIDAMTSLKNRNFLNDNMELWDSNKVYPQTIIVIDLKGLKEINDTNGSNEGDRQIKAAANILVKSQRENSEIMRTDGNEFMIYLVGYSEKNILTYLHKLNKDFKNLPYEYGAKFGYSMITDEIKTLDDAINESLIMMKEK